MINITKTLIHLHLFALNYIFALKYTCLHSSALTCTQMIIPSLKTLTNTLNCTQLHSITFLLSNTLVCTHLHSIQKMILTSLKTLICTQLHSNVLTYIFLHLIALICTKLHSNGLKCTYYSDSIRYKVKVFRNTNQESFEMEKFLKCIHFLWLLF